MNIKILDSWLREYLKTKATPNELAEKLSLTSLSVERIENYGNDFIYEMEVTTNRIDLFSVTGVAREASAILPRFNISAEFIPANLERIEGTKIPIEIINNPKLVNRVLAVAMDVEIKSSSKEIKEKLETSGIRSLNNVIDVTNYVMRVIGHPTHVFDLDRLNSKKLIIREALRGEEILTLDNKNYKLSGGEIIAKNDKGEIVDLLGVMGLSNSVVTENTKRILFFIDNNNPHIIRKASMELGIRTEAANINEKGISPELSMDALLYGISLFKKEANAKNISKIIDIYDNKPRSKKISVSLTKVNKVIGVNVDIKNYLKSLEALGFKAKLTAKDIEVEIPSFRLNDMEIEEDVIEEIARLYGYHNLPSILPQTEEPLNYSFVSVFYWEQKAKHVLKDWGFTETYTYSFIPEEMFEGPLETSVEISNPLTKDYMYMRNSLVPSLLNVVSNNKNFDEIKIFEIGNIYIKNENELPLEKLKLSGLIKKENANFYEVKGLIEQLLNDLGIREISFKTSNATGMGASVFIKNEYLGEIEVLDKNLIDFELDFETITNNSTLKKTYKPFAKYPPIVEDISIVINKESSTEELIEEIKSQSHLIVDVSLTGTYENTKTFHVVYQDFEKNLTKEDVSKIRDKVVFAVKSKFQASIK